MNNLNLTRTLMFVANCYSSYTEAFEFIIQVRTAGWIIYSKLVTNHRWIFILAVLEYLLDSYQNQNI